MFREISTRIALQFTGFVFGLLLVNGVVFLAADFEHARRQAAFRLDRSFQSIAERMHGERVEMPLALPPMFRERVRIIGPGGTPVHVGVFFTDLPLPVKEGISEITVQDEPFRVLTAPVIRNGRQLGVIQVADIERFHSGDLPDRARRYLLVSVVISALTFFVGLLFARRSLRPAEEAMRRLEQFTQDASHELRTPLAALQSSLDLALKTGKHEEGIRSAQEDVHTLTTLVERLLALARLDALALERQSVDLSLLLDEMIVKQRPVAKEKTIDLIADIAPGVTVEADPALVRQMIGNLLANALKFTQAKGSIHVILTSDRFSVADTGIGIPPDVLPHIFDRFYRADASRSEGGLGLGLALVHRIVELHEWKIDVISETGKGSTFTVGFGKSK